MNTLGVSELQIQSLAVSETMLLLLERVASSLCLYCYNCVDRRLFLFPHYIYYYNKKSIYIPYLDQPVLIFPFIIISSYLGAILKKMKRIISFNFKNMQECMRRIGVH